MVAFRISQNGGWNGVGPALPLLKAAVAQGLRNAGRGLTEMVGQSIEISSPEVGLVPVEAIMDRAGGPANPVLAIYLAVSGDISGHLVLLLDLDSAAGLAGVLLEAPAEQRTFGDGAAERRGLDSMELSALGEAGNLAGSLVLNALADASGLKIYPSTPAVVSDMAGAILSSIVADLIISYDEVLLIETGFRGSRDRINGMFFFLPHLESLHILSEALEKKSCSQNY